MPLVEAILDERAARLSADLSHGQRIMARHALWICACVTLRDAPTWLVYDDHDGRVWWCRLPDGVAADEVVDAQVSAGGHADPGSVLAWLRGDVSDPWAGGDGDGDAGVVPELGRLIRGA